MADAAQPKKPPNFFDEDPTQKLSRLQLAGGLVGAAAVVYSTVGLLPGWFHTGPRRPEAVYYAVMIVGGLAAGAMLGKRRIVGALAGAVGCSGATMAVAIVHQRVTSSYDLLFILIGLAGAAPGYGLYGLCDRFARSMSEERQPEPDDDR